MQSAVPFLSQRHITCPYPHSSTHSLPCHLLSPRSYPPECFLSPSLPAQVMNTCPGAHHCQTYLFPTTCPDPGPNSGGGWGCGSQTKDRRPEGAGARGAITRGLLLPLSNPPSEMRTKGVTKQ